MTFLRLFLTSMARADQLSHYDIIMDLQGDPGQVKDWVEGVVDDLQQRQS